jgi:hypothetical protein
MRRRGQPDYLDHYLPGGDIAYAVDAPVSTVSTAG